jgi:hypothetical protein
MMSFVLACAICFGSADPRVTYVLMAMLALPFTIVGGMLTVLYYNGVLGSPKADAAPDEMPR